jgi:hypothetical protein
MPLMRRAKAAEWAARPVPATLEPAHASGTRSGWLTTEPGTVEPIMRRSASRVRMLSLPYALLLTALGILLVSIGYAGGRDGRPWAEAVFWAGHMLAFLPLALVATAPGVASGTRVAAVLGEAFAQAIGKWMYSPLAFAFPDEMQHWRTASDILRTHHLFTPSPLLPVSPVFPGLEEITTSLMSVTHLGLFVAGSIVVGLSHLALAGAAFLLVQRIAGNDRLAAAAALIFAISPHAAFFNEMFVYEAPALLFMAVALYAGVGAPGRRSPDRFVAGICIAALPVTHHVTAAVTALVLLATGVAAVLQKRPDAGRRLLVLGLLAAVATVAWILAVAPMTYDYLAGPVKTVLQGFLHEGSVAGKSSPTPPGSPLNTAFSIAAALTMAALGATGVFLSWRRSDNRTMRVFAGLGLTYFIVLAVRALASDGAELATRLLTYSYLFAGIAAALVVVRMWNGARRIGGLAAIVALTLVFVGNTTSGWPPSWELVPGHFRVDGFESGVDGNGREAAAWISRHVPNNDRVACDFTSCALIGAAGRQYPVGDAGKLYYAPRADAAVRRLLADREIAFVVVDRRLTTQLPITGQYFSHDQQSGHHLRPLPAAGLSKFDRLPGASRVYDNGPIAIYDVRGVTHGS